MKYLLDTANLAEIRRFYDIFPIAGVTSNPSIVKREGNIDFFDHMKEIRSIIGIDKLLHIQVTASDTDGMLRDADTLLNKVDSEVYVKFLLLWKVLKLLNSLRLKISMSQEPLSIANSRIPCYGSRRRLYCSLLQSYGKYGYQF